MTFDQVSQTTEFLANIVTILGVLSIGYIYKVEIYNKKYITYIGNINFTEPTKDYSENINIYPLNFYEQQSRS